MVKINAPLCSLGEGPLWHKETGEFVFTDIINGLLYAWNPKTLQYRELLSCSYQLGAFLFDTDGDLILFTERGVMHSSYKKQNRKILPLFPMELQPGERFNDAICTPDGRMLAGTKTEQNENGTLYLFEKNTEPTPLIKNLKISNGMGFSNDGSTFYHTDSGRRKIFQYHYIAGKRFCLSGGFETQGAPPFWEKGPFGKIVWEETGADQAVPDGMTIDSQGNIWTALWGRGCVCCIDPLSGKIQKSLSFPASQVSSITFGGTDLCHALVTSASIGTSGAPNGETYHFHTDIPGREEYRYLL